MADTEIIATSAVKNLIAKTSCLKAFIKDGDKEPFYDGAIYAYSDNDKKNASYRGRIPVQVKSKTVDDPYVDTAMYSISRDMFDAYLKDGGIAFFFVLVSKDGGKYKVFFTNLLPYKINRLVHRMGTQKTKQTQCLPFPTDPIDIIDWSLNYLRDCEKQSVLKQQKIRESLTIEELAKTGQLSNLSFGFTSIRKTDEAFNNLFKNELYLYANLKTGIEIPVQLFEGGDRVISTQLNFDVIVDGRVFFNTVGIEMTNETITTRFGKNISFSSPRGIYGNVKATLNYRLTGTLSEMIGDAEFIVALANNGKMTIFNHETQLDPGFDATGIERILNQLQFEKTTLDAAGVKKELDAESLTDNDRMWLRILNIALVNEQEVSITPSVPMEIGNLVMSTIQIANLSIFILVQRTSEKGYKIYNPFRNSLDFAVSVQADDDQVFRITKYYLLTDENFCSMSNLDLKAIFDDIIAVGSNPVNLQEANKLMFRAIFAYDQSTDKCGDLLEFAKRIICWSTNQDQDVENDLYSKTIAELNMLQIRKRERQLRPEEVDQLHEIIVKYPDNNTILTGTYILLENYEMALFHFKELSDDDRETFIKFPIMNLWARNNSDQEKSAT